jgi:RNA polymerase sigma-54 factor
MQQADMLQLTDRDFQNLIVEVEQSPLFRRLFRKEKIIRYHRFQGTDISGDFYRTDTENIADSGSLDIESLLEKRKEIVRRIAKLGIQKFKKYFLFCEPGVTKEETAAACHLPVREVEAINSLVNDFAVMSEFYHPSAFESQAVHYTRIASIEKCPEGFIIGYYSPSYARGRYEIDYDKFEQLLREHRLAAGETKQARQLFKKMQLINARKDTINNLLQKLIKKQALYLETGEKKSLLPFTQKELAGEIGVARSSVSRAIRYKSLCTPWEEEVPLKDFLPGPKQFKKRIIGQLLRSESGLKSDKDACAALLEKFGISISRRSVAKLRQELRLPARGKAAQAGGIK